MHCRKPNDIKEKLSDLKPTCPNKNELRHANLTFHCSVFFLFLSHVLFLNILLLKVQSYKIYNDGSFVFLFLLTYCLAINS